MKRVTKQEKCNFCDRMFRADSKRHYVFPIPICEAFPSGGLPHEGAYSCTGCFPSIRNLQIEQGLVKIGYADQAKESVDGDNKV